MKEKLRAFLENKSVLFLTYSAAAIAASIQMVLLGKKTFSGEFPTGEYTRYNNYVVFRNSFWHLIHNQDLYSLYPAEQWDLYKYSPSFALAMMPFAYMPDWLGLTVWSLLGSTLLFYGMSKIPYTNQRSLLLMLWFLIPEMLTATQSAQSNVLMAALLIIAFVALENHKTWLGTFMIVMTLFIKVYGGLAFLLFFLYPDKRNFILSSIIWIALIGILPLLVVSPLQLSELYRSWGRLLINDHTASQGMSVMGILEIWFNILLDKTVVAAAGLLLLVLPLVKVRSYKEPLFRILLMASILIWSVIFNHKAESPTFIIAAAGVAIWYFTQERNPVNLILLVLVFIFTCLSQTDLFPPSIRNDFFRPYVIKVAPCIMVWIMIQYQLWSGKGKLRQPAMG